MNATPHLTPARALIVKEFRSTYGDFTVEADFKIAPGERVALFAPSGSGKTTLLRWLAGFESQATGALFLGEHSLAQLPPEKREFGVVFQDYALFPHWTTLENVAFGLEMRGASRSERERAALAFLQKLHIAHRAKTLAGLLSGGEKQRVALARALVWKPQALLLDEPFAALDLAARKKARETVLELLRETPVPLLFVTHDSEDVAKLATRTLKYSGSDDGLTHRFTDA